MDRFSPIQLLATVNGLKAIYVDDMLYRIIVKKIDKDSDGFVSEQELKDWVNYVHKKYLWNDVDHRWKEYNKDNDLKLTWSEYVTTSYGVETGRLSNFCSLLSPSWCLMM